MREMTERQIRKWVFSGAMHPMALVQEPLARRIRERYAEIWAESWSDLDPHKYPWPRAVMLQDAVAATFQDQFRGVSRKRHYWRLLDQVWLVVFGEHHPSATAE